MEVAFSETIQALNGVQQRLSSLYDSFALSPAQLFTVAELDKVRVL